MNTNYSLLKKLLPYLERFEEERSDEDESVEAFSQWLEMKTTHKSRKNKISPEDDTVHSGILMSVINLFKYLKNYTKKFLEATPINTLEDLIFLINLSDGRPVTKSELIARNISELTSGTEVLKRLNKLGLTQEYQDPLDRRSKHVVISKEGLEAVERLMPELRLTARIMCGNLSDYHQQNLWKTLASLEDFHHKVYKSERNSSLDRIAGLRLDE